MNAPDSPSLIGKPIPRKEDLRLLGVRAGGEGGTTPALAVVINAVVDALAEFGVKHLEMPATPQRIWRAIQQSRRPGAAAPSRA
ncbi:MAG: hypothetical protein A3I01_10405 [Betaproteobacteria bacterium RIFCSPLOWO2_02_FULL_65_24]|nr:MAG: hypothetical protein A3I01_10405 [Betaproteobacteria bacterium RIFCSPLOWO2_02_FULL_65_24]